MTALVTYDEMRRAVEVYATVDELKGIRDKAEALRHYARQRGDVALEAWVTEIKLRASRRIGELSSALEKHERSRTDLRPDRGTQTKRAELAAVGISKSEAHRCEQIASVPAGQFEEYIAKKKAAGKPVTVDEVVKMAARQAKERKRADDLARPVAVDLPEGVIHGDFRKHAHKIADNSVDLIFTDPPYDEDAVSLYEDAAREAARILKPGASLIAYSGHRFLPDVYAGMSKHLRYWWTCACVHEGGNSLMQRLGIRAGWKPLVWYVKGTRGDISNVIVDTVRGDREKFAHEWQQAQSEAEYFIDKLCAPGGLVVDFFLGGGTTKAAAQKLGRRCIGFEVNAASLERTTKRLAA